MGLIVMGSTAGLKYKPSTMTRRQRIENKGYKVSIVMNSGNYIASKGNQTYRAASITALHKQIFGY